jgi:putative SOS response-associated peptidase YedK
MEDAGGKPVFNFVSEGRSFADSDRALILATGFYEYTAPKDAKARLKDQHFFELKGSEWFWIAGLVKHDCFTMLTAEPGPDMKPYHDRQICVLRPEEGLHWLSCRVPKANCFKALHRGRSR